jgi:hypothetical protein
LKGKGICEFKLELNPGSGGLESLTPNGNELDDSVEEGTAAKDGNGTGEDEHKDEDSTIGGDWSGDSFGCVVACCDVSGSGCWLLLEDDAFDMSEPESELPD